MRSAGAALLVVVATLLTPFAVTATWLSSTIDSTDAYVETVAPLADDPALRRELADEMTDAAVAEIQDHLPVGVPEGIEDMTRTAAEQVVKDPQFPEFWREANRDAHREFLRVMDDDAAADGWVTVDLSPLMQGLYEVLAEDTGLPLSGLPAPELRVPVARESQLADYRTAYHLVDGSAFALTVAWILLVGLAVLLGHGWRGRLRVLGAAGLGLALGALLVRVSTSPAADAVARQAEPGRRGLVALILDVVGDSLDSRATTIAVVAALGGLLVIAVTLVPARRSRPAQPWG
ncbi:MAG TPA: hypothetical protein VNS55_01805 [Nocardioides sp.]|nr:hypothetical protein [Nocardioides sp.]